MSLALIDWLIVCCVFLFSCSIAVMASRYTKSVAGFLAANRCAGRYIISVADGAAGMGAIGTISMWQMFYENGFTGNWWYMTLIPASIIISVTGYIIYRYRQTQVMTMAQFFGIRYSNKFRIFAGILAFISGTVNFGIFPAIAGNFFMYFCNLPEAFIIAGITVKTFPVIMAIVLITSLSFAWAGGMITIMITDFFQGMFCNIVFLVSVIAIFCVIDWDKAADALAMAPVGKSMVHPFKGDQIENFNIWYYVIAAVGLFYSFMSWQGNQGFNCSAKTPHEAKMASILGNWRSFAQMVLIFLFPIVAYMLMTYPAYSDFAIGVNGVLDKIDNVQVRNQMAVPVIFARFLPIGIRGALAAAMLVAFISTHNTYLHSWGSIFIQDVVMPFRKKPFAVQQHLWFLRFSILGVAIFIFCFSMFFRQVEAILMFFALTGAIFLGGSGAVIIGGLYWKRGTTSGAWGSMIVGITVAVAGFISQQAWPVWFNGSKFPINGQRVLAIAMALSSLTYITLSLLESKIFNLDQMLHRGKYAISKEDAASEQGTGKPKKEYNIILQRLGLSHEFSFTDKLIFWATVGWSMIWFVIFLIGTVYNLLVDVSDRAWFEYWKIYSWISFFIAIVTTIWFIIGGLMNVKQMFRDLAVAESDVKDDGMVIDHHNSNENISEKV